MGEEGGMGVMYFGAVVYNVVEGMLLWEGLCCGQECVENSAGFNYL